MPDTKLFTEFVSPITTYDPDNLNIYGATVSADGRMPIALLPFRRVINVKSAPYGALGNDSDDTVAIAAAVAAAGEGDAVYFPGHGNNIFVTKDALAAAINKLTIIADGGATLKAHQTPTNTGAEPLAIDGHFIQAEDIDDLHVIGLRFEGPATTTGYGANLSSVNQNEPGTVFLKGCSRAVVDNCQFIFNGTFLGGSVFITGNGDNTINIPANDNTVKNCYAEKAGAFTYEHGWANRNECIYNRSFDGWQNAYSGIANAFQPTFTGTANLDFNDNGASADTIVRASGSWITDGYLAGDVIVVSSTTNNNTEFKIVSLTALTITLATGVITDEQNTSGNVLAIRNNDDNKCNNNWGIRPARMGIEDIGDSIQWSLRTQINHNIIKSTGQDQVNFSGTGFGISAAGKDVECSFNTIIDFDSIGLEPVSQNGRYVGNHIEQPLWSTRLDTGSGISIDGVTPPNDGNMFSAHFVKRCNVGLQVNGDAGLVSINNCFFMDNREFGVAFAGLTGDHTTVTMTGGGFLYTIPIDEHKGTVTDRFALSLPPNSTADGVQITYASTAGGGTGSGDNAIDAGSNNVSYVNLQVKDNGIQSNSSNVRIQGAGDNCSFIGGNYNTAVVDFSNNTNVTWSGVKHTGTKTSWGGATTQTLSGAGAVDLLHEVTDFTSTGATDALTLADGYEGQVKEIWHVSDGGSGILTPSNLLGGTTVTFTAVNDFIGMRFSNGNWRKIYGNVNPA